MSSQPSSPVTLAPTFVAAKVASTLALVEQARTLGPAQIETCVAMLRNIRSATHALEHQKIERAQARAALSAVGLLELAEEAIINAVASIPAASLSGQHEGPLAVTHWLEGAVLGTCLEGLPVIHRLLVPRLVNPWRTVTEHSY